MLFRVDAKSLEIQVSTDPTSKINNSSVWLDGKRRDRVTDRYGWFDDLEDALTCQSKAIQHKRNEIATQIVDLTHVSDQLSKLSVSTRKRLQITIQEYNNDSFFD